MWNNSFTDNALIKISFFKKTCGFIYLFIFALLHGMRDLNSLTRDRTHAPCTGSRVLTTGLPGKSLKFLKQSDNHKNNTCIYVNVRDPNL